ncbi:MAG TPA: NAD(P)H nitroreductase [Bacteroidetes bacterium]|nr:NAD(P)H nitroreductase [Bacteroidota bacterium]
MKFPELVIKRQSDRKYADKPVEKEKTERCLEAARMAPSASNSQPWTFVVVDDPVLVKKVAHKTFGPLKSFNKFVPQAPVIVAIVMEPPKLITEVGGRIKKKEYPLIDIGIAAAHFCLQATELGLGTCMLGWFDEKAVKELIRVPENKNIPLLITLGYTPDDYKHRKKIRKDFSKVVRKNYYE